MELLTPELWSALYKIAGGGVIGGLLATFGLITVAKTKSSVDRRKNDQEFSLGITAEQRKWFEVLEKQVEQYAAKTDALHKAFDSQREYYDKSMMAQREGYEEQLQRQEEIYTKKLEQQESHCETEIKKLQARLDLAEEKLLKVMRQRSKLFQRMNKHGIDVGDIDD